MYGWWCDLHNKLEPWRRAGRIHQSRCADNSPGTTSVPLRSGATTQVSKCSLRFCCMHSHFSTAASDGIPSKMAGATELNTITPAQAIRHYASAARRWCGS